MLVFRVEREEHESMRMAEASNRMCRGRTERRRDREREEGGCGEECLWGRRGIYSLEGEEQVGSVLRALGKSPWGGVEKGRIESSR